MELNFVCVCHRPCTYAHTNLFCAWYVANKFSRSNAEIRHNQFHLSCTNRESYTGLCATVDSMVVRVEAVINLPLNWLLLQRCLSSSGQRFIFRVPLLVPKFLTFVKAQNKDLHTDRWVLLHQQSTSKGVLLIWGIDQESCAAIEAVNYQPFFGHGRVTFCVITPDWSKGWFTVMCV